MNGRSTAICLAVLLAGCGAGSGPGDVRDDVRTDTPDAADPGIADTRDAADRPAPADVELGEPGSDPGTLDAAPDPGGDPGSGDSVEPGDVPADAPEVWAPHPEPKTIPLYQGGTVLEFALDFTPDQWTLFQAAITQGIKNYAHCSFTFGADTFVDAACRPKGNPDSWKDQKKPQFLVRFNHWDKNGRFKGLRAMNLDRSASHFAPVRSRLAMQFMADAGVEASRVSHVRLTVSGQDYGLYQNVEVVDHEFLEDHWEDPSGNLYEDGSKLSTNEEVNDTTRLQDLNALVAAEPLDGDHGAFFTALAALVDIHQVLREMAAESVLPTGNNYVNGGTNFLWYDHPGRGFLVIPWDFDDVFSPAARTDSDLWAYWGEPAAALAPNRLWQLVQQDPAWKAEFLGYVRQFRDGPFPALKELAASVCTLVRPVHEADPFRNGDMAQFDADCADIAARVDARITFLQQAAP